jgi:hypothetical protein
MPQLRPRLAAGDSGPLDHHGEIGARARQTVDELRGGSGRLRLHLVVRILAGVLLDAGARVDDEEVAGSEGSRAKVRHPVEPDVGERRAVARDALNQLQASAEERASVMSGTPGGRRHSMVSRGRCGSLFPLPPPFPPLA